ncbi:hypothetical protein GCM10022408_02860 [Hymenobacter fastidiosus]|uniref:Uncharacterized protein n=1 Tax=Hymenobacter fastidiosus TaxID=486264 RepID=A0ABP7RD23_9BACT
MLHSPPHARRGNARPDGVSIIHRANAHIGQQRPINGGGHCGYGILLCQAAPAQAGKQEADQAKEGPEDGQQQQGQPEYDGVRDPEYALNGRELKTGFPPGAGWGAAGQEPRVTPPYLI